MIFGRRKKIHIDTLIDKDMIIRGDTKVSGGVRLDGKIYGNFTVSNIGNILSNHIIIDGKVIGNIKSSEYIEINSNAEIQGDIEYNNIEIHAGAKVIGSLKKMNQKEIGKFLKDEQDQNN
jgi:cytoskeletal protein CcmA (bactofilin family)